MDPIGKILGKKEYRKKGFRGAGPKYWCTLCNEYHRKFSDLGDEHRKYAEEY